MKLELSTYTIVPKVLNPTVQYKLDGNVSGAKAAIPYSLELDLTSLSKGEHELTVEVYRGNTQLGRKNYVLMVNNDSISLKKK